MLKCFFLIFFASHFFPVSNNFIFVVILYNECIFFYILKMDIDSMGFNLLRFSLRRFYVEFCCKLPEVKWERVHSIVIEWLYNIYTNYIHYIPACRHDEFLHHFNQFTLQAYIRTKSLPYFI